MPKVEKRGDMWTTRVSLTNPDTGQRIQPRITARTKRELDAEVAAVRAAFNNGTWVEPNTTLLIDWLHEWFATYRRSGSTRYSRNRAIEAHVAPHRIASIPLGKLRPIHMQAFVDDLAAKHLSASYIEQLLAPLRMAFERAERLELIGKSPLDAVDLPPRVAPTWTILSEAQVSMLLQAMQEQMNGALWVIAATLGPRRGELMGLRWSDVDFAASCITIARTHTRSEAGVWVIGELAKTSHSRRTLQLPAICRTALQTHRREQLERRLRLGDIWYATDAVFDAGDGRHWKNPYRLEQQLKRVLAAAGLPTCRPHDLRHTAATHMIRRLVPIPTVSRILGHKSPAITMKVYAHVLDDMQRDATDALDRMYGDPFNDGSCPDRAHVASD